jgi:hypothetical protein
MRAKQLRTPGPSPLTNPSIISLAHRLPAEPGISNLVILGPSHFDRASSIRECKPRFSKVNHFISGLVFMFEMNQVHSGHVSHFEMEFLSRVPA